ALCLAVVVALGGVALTIGGPVLAPLGIGLGAFLVLGSVSEIVARSWTRGQTFATGFRRARGLPRSTWGTVLAHAGVGIAGIGIAASAWSAESIAALRPGERIVAGPYAVQLD